MDKMSEDEKKSIDMLEKYITEHKFYNIKQSDGLEDNIKILLDLYNKTKEDKNRYYYEWKHLEANIINKINELEEINMDVFTFEIAEDLKKLLEEN